MKQEQAKKQGITLVNVPFWWDWNADRYLCVVILLNFVIFVFLLFLLSYLVNLIVTV